MWQIAANMTHQKAEVDCNKVKNIRTILISFKFFLRTKLKLFSFQGKVLDLD